jgi:hypothetical protein
MLKWLGIALTVGVCVASVGHSAQTEVRVSGSVIDRVSGQPVPGALVHLLQSQPLRAWDARAGQGTEPAIVATADGARRFSVVTPSGRYGACQESCV